MFQQLTIACKHLVNYGIIQFIMFFQKIPVLLTASTGIAATINKGSSTLHHTFGLGPFNRTTMGNVKKHKNLSDLDDDDDDDQIRSIIDDQAIESDDEGSFGLDEGVIIRKISSKKKFLERTEQILQSHCIFIDEVSMLDNKVLMKVDEMLRTLCHRPNTLFGGKLLMIVGDRCQLVPPMGPRHSVYANMKLMSDFHHLQLTSQMRQRKPESEKFLCMLRKVFII